MKKANGSLGSWRVAQLYDQHAVNQLTAACGGEGGHGLNIFARLVLLKLVGAYEIEGIAHCVPHVPEVSGVIRRRKVVFRGIQNGQGFKAVVRYGQLGG